MEQIFTLSDNESETSEDLEDLRQMEVKNASPQTKLSLAAPHSPRGEQQMWQRKHSIHDENLLRSRTGEDEGSVGADLFRRRSRSAPPALWAAKKYGRQLRRMSDEFDVFFSEKDMKKVRSAGTSRQMRPSKSWFDFLWSHKES